MPAKYTPEQRIAVFWSRVDRYGPIPDYRPDLGPCWLWTAGHTTDGYGYMYWRIEGQKQRCAAHVIAYRELVGVIPAGLELDHLCRVRDCVRTSHLEPVTHRENSLRGVGIATLNASLTQCRRGHPFDDTNTYRGVPGVRGCRTCQREAVHRYRARKRVAS